MNFSRGTTPTIPCCIKNKDGTVVDISGYDVIEISIKQNDDNILLIDKEDITFEDGGVFSFTLTQIDTLSLVDGFAYAQIRARKGDAAIVTNILRLNIGEIVKEGVI